MKDLAVIIVSTNEAHWLGRCLPSLFVALDGLDSDIVVVNNGADPATRVLLETDFPRVRVLDTENHGFPHANNRALMTVNARYVLFLNPDTEILDGKLMDLVTRLDATPAIGLAGCRQVAPDGGLQLSMRRFPTATRLLMEALGSERWPFRASWTGQRILDASSYAQEYEPDWTSGSFMFVRREALESAGWLDERLFLYADDPDLARRIKNAGWAVRHLPQMTILHHADKMGWSERGHAQYAYATRIYLRKHFGKLHGRMTLAALVFGYALRALLFPVLRPSEPEAARAMRRALATAIGRAGAPYEPPPVTALRSRTREAL
jgi:GT2 family glycosyltransferase